MKPRRGIVLSNLTDVGLERPQNEDYYGYAEPEAEALFAYKGRLVIVADGMGGHQAGEIASRVAVDTVRDTYLASPGDDTQMALTEAFHAANSAVYEIARSQPAFQGMGTTCSALVLKDDQAFFAHVGDSRIYLIRDGMILQLTRDHSVVMEKVREGVLTEEEARVHADRNLISRAIGVAPSVQVDGSPLPIPTYEGDVFVLCSDGLSTLVSAEEIRDIVTNQHPQDACQTLVELAKTRGGYDNITVQIVKLADELRQTKEDVSPFEPTKSKQKRLLLVLLGVLMLALLLAAGFFYFRKPPRPQQPAPETTPGQQQEKAAIFRLHSRFLVYGGDPQLSVPSSILRGIHEKLEV